MPTILLGDLNSKHQTWGCQKTNPNGSKLHKFASEQRIIISPPAEPTFHRSGRLPDILDIALISNLPINLHHVVLNELDSDHVPVISTLNEQIKDKNPIPKLINAPINWEAFRKNLDEKLNNQKRYSDLEDINKSIEHLTDTIKIAVTQAQNKKHTASPQSTNPLPNAVQKLIKEKHKTRRLWQRTRNLAVKKRLNQLNRRVKWELDNLRYNSYRTYLEKINPNDSSLWLATKRILNQRNIIPPLKNGIAKYDTNFEKSEAFAEYFETCFTSEDDYIPQRESPDEILSLTNNEHNIIIPTSPKEIQLLISKLKSKKSPGHDLITNKILKNLTSKALSYLASLFNSAMRFATFPSSWKHAIIVPIHKPGKPANSPTSYRPISLLPTISKLYERILLERIKPYLHAIPKHQFGFKTKHSTCHQIQRISEIIVHGFEKKQYTTAAFLDLTQAFDKVWHRGLQQKLKILNLPIYLLKTITSFISNRSFKVRVETDFSQPHQIKAGVPQGSVLGPTLFNIYCYDIPTPPNSQLAMFADDTTILTQDSSLELAIQNLQSSLNEIISWFQKWKLNLNPTKSEVKIFTLKRYTNPKNIHINNQIIQWNNKDDAVKYLGVHLDEKLTWNLHINKKLVQGYTRMRILYPLVNYRSTLQLKSSLLLYTSIIRPLLTYACPVWAAASTTKIKKIQALQNKFLRICLKAPWYMRNRQIHNDTGISQINIWIKTQFKNFHTKLKDSDGARHYQLGKKTQNRRLRPRLPQDILISDTEEHSSEDVE